MKVNTEHLNAAVEWLEAGCGGTNLDAAIARAAYQFQINREVLEAAYDRACLSRAASCGLEDA